ncbi:hypothetical protein JCM6882_006141 [Rhodosporidiobolus microsporus]
MALEARLNTFFSDLRLAFGQVKPPGLDEWHVAIWRAFHANRARWTDAQALEVLRALEGLLPRAVRGEILEVDQLIQPQQLNAFPWQPLPQPRHPLRNSHNPHLFPPAPPPALQLFNNEYPLAGTVAPGAASAPALASGGHPLSPHHSRSGSSSAIVAADDVSYHLDLWPLLTQIRAAFEGFIGDYYPREEHADQLATQARWDLAVRTFVREEWVAWGVEEGGLARVQAREMLEQVLAHLRNDTFKVFPPIQLFAMLPAEFGRFVNPQPPSQPPHPQPTSRPSSSRSQAASPAANAWTAGEYYSMDGYRQTLQDWLQQNSHLQRPHSGSSAAGGQHTMRELARGHRRMTASQARRYGTTVQAFAAGV